MALGSTDIFVEKRERGERTGSEVDRVWLRCGQRLRSSGVTSCIFLSETGGVAICWGIWGDVGEEVEDSREGLAWLL